MRTIIRLLFLALIGLELLAWADIVPLPDPTFTWFGLVGTAAAAWIFLEVARLPRWLEAVVFGDVVLDAASDIYRLYERWAPSYPWDRLMHLIGGAIVALCAFEILRRFLERGWIASPRPDLLLAVGAFLFSGFAGFLYELWEFITDVVYTKKSLALGDGRDTVDDLILNLAGAAVVLFMRVLSSRAARHQAPGTRN